MNNFKFLTDNIPEIPEHRDDWWNEADVISFMQEYQVIQNFSVPDLELPN